MTKPMLQVEPRTSTQIKLGSVTIGALAFRRLVIATACSGVALVAIADLILPEPIGGLRTSVVGWSGVAIVGVAAALNAILNFQLSDPAKSPAGSGAD